MLRLITVLAFAAAAFGQTAEKAIDDQIRKLRSVPDDKRGAVTRALAEKIHRLPAGPNKLAVAQHLTNLSTEGDFGKETLRKVASTLSEALTEQQVTDEQQFGSLASLIRYEHVDIANDSPALKAAIAKLAADDERRQQLDFTLTDLTGQTWTLKKLSGKVVMVNFWATWCPPCRKEMPDLNALYNQFKKQGLVILALSDEERKTVEPFIQEKRYAYPILPDPGGKVAKDFGVDGIPKTFVYDRTGKMVAQSIDMRTRGQFLAMLAEAGIQ